jgi:pimeloyl-ACP methyl ester carboxylesterase
MASPFRAAAIALLLLTAAPVAAQVNLLDGYADRLNRGASAAKGAVIYSPGLDAGSDGVTVDATPYFLDFLYTSGWDVFRLPRQRTDDTLEESIRAVQAASDNLRKAGYDKLVLAGQSFGAWTSLAAAQRATEPFQAVIALAPAAFGRPEESPNWIHNADGLYPLLQASTARRTLIFLFKDDPYEPGGREDRVREIFIDRDLTADVVSPAELAGHSVGITRGFARRYGACIRDFVEAEPAAAFFVCPDTSNPGSFDLPTDLEIRPPLPGVTPALIGMSGRWYGMYRHGREIQLIVEQIEDSRVRAVYAYGALSRDGDDRSGFTRRRGEFEPVSGTLVFAEPQAENVLEAYLVAPGELAFRLTNRRTGESLQTRLRRLD